MRKVLFALVLCTITAAVSTEAATVFDNGGPLTNVVGWDATGNIEADDFSFGSNKQIRSGTIFFYDDPGSWDGTFEWFIYQDTSGSPGSLLTSGMGVNVNTTNTGLTHDNGSVIRALTFGLDSFFDAAANTSYWFGVHLASDFIRSDVRWATASVHGAGNNYFQSGGIGGWRMQSSTSELAFSLSDASTVPVPAAVWLFGSALGLLGWVRRKEN